MATSASALFQPEQLTDQNTLQFTVNVLETHFALDAHGTRCQRRDLWHVLVTAAARRSTIEATCADLADAPDSNTIRSHLNAQLEGLESDLHGLEQQCNKALASQLPPWLRPAPQMVAIDLHDEPFYGQDDPQDPDCWVCRGEAHAGTTRFYRCATAYLMRHEVRLTVAVVFVHPADSLLAVLQRLLQQLRGLNLTVACLYLDKAFCSVPVLRYLQEQTQLAAIIAAPRRGVTGGVRALCRGRVSYRTTHTFASAKNGAVTVPVGVVRTLARRRDGRRCIQWLVYVLLRVPLTVTLLQVRQRYRLRFGIESSYRLLEQVRARTTSPRPALRLLLIGLALVLCNLWIGLHWRFLRRQGSGPRRVAREHFPLERMARFLSRAVEAIYGVVSCICPPNVKNGIY